VFETEAEKGVFLGPSKCGEHKDEWWESSPTLRQGNFHTTKIFTV